MILVRINDDINILNSLYHVTQFLVHLDYLLRPHPIRIFASQIFYQKIILKRLYKVYLKIEPFVNEETYVKCVNNDYNLPKAFETFFIRLDKKTKL